ncbi:hypothetical protein CKAH01_08025 [Colletotrichum kahawae]|uniref:Uncharacterized protein n=1 Tax=Colletotrichum kahawae TaxID=34407 RepID=A0AAD9Y287_COLKA|nr:hypothetical protein CKAH01_08025 [Colletotrichum kahawae]
MAASVKERYQKVREQYGEVIDIRSKAKQTLDNCQKTQNMVVSAAMSLWNLSSAEDKFKALDQRLARRLESLRNLDDPSSDYSEDDDESEDDDDSEKNSDGNDEEGESDSDAISEVENDNSQEAETQSTETTTTSQSHKNADQGQESDSTKKRRRGESEGLESDLESLFSKRKRSKNDAGGRVPAFDGEDLKLAQFLRETSQLSIERQIESFRYIHPMGKQMMMEWMSLARRFMR